MPVALSCAVVSPLGADALVEIDLPRSPGRSSHESRSLADCSHRVTAGPLWSLLRIPLRAPHVPGELRLSRSAGPSLGGSRSARAHWRSGHGCGLCQLLVCADTAPVSPTGKTNRRGCRRIPPLPHRLQPLRCGRRIHRGSSADLVCGCRLLPDGRAGRCHHGLVSVCHAGSRSRLAAPVNRLFPRTALCSHRAQPCDARNLVPGESRHR